MILTVVSGRLDVIKTVDYEKIFCQQIFSFLFYSGDPRSGKQQAIDMASNDMMIAEILKRNEIDLVELQKDWEHRCDQLELELQEAGKQLVESTVYYKKEINSTEKQKKSELEAVQKEKLEYEEKCIELEAELKEMRKDSFHFEEKAKKLQKEIDLLCKYG